MGGTVEDYQDALGEYEKAADAARDMMGLIRQVNECMYPSNFHSFLGWSFGINDQIPRGERFGSKGKVDLGNWPDRDRMKEVFAAWHQALKKLQHAWEELPEERRRGLQSPPKTMDARGW